MINPRKKIYLLIASNLTAIILILFFIMIPSLKDIKDLKRGIHEQRLEIEKRYLETHGSKRTINLNKIKNNITELSSIFVQKDFELEFITTLEELALENNLEQQIKLQSDNQKITGSIKTIPIQIFLEGNFIDFLKYLQGLEKLKYYININYIDLTSSFLKKELIVPSQEKLGRVKISILGETYWEI